LPLLKFQPSYYSCAVTYCTGEDSGNSIPSEILTPSFP